MWQNKLKYIIVLIYLNYICDCAVMHSHSSHLNRERVEDGAYSPRDRGHVSESDEHNSDFDHEAILGSIKDAEEFDHLTPAESKRRLGILLQKMDLDGDKAITRQELRAWILRSFKMLTEEEAEERRQDVDTNNDGKVTWDEYVADTYGLGEDVSKEELEQENEELMADDKLMWEAADVNHDGILEGDEWVAFSHPEEHPVMMPIIMNQTLRERDTDNDGAISFQEYIGERGKNRDKQWIYVEKDKFDRELDLNKDGKLTGNEILSWMVPSNEEIADEEVQHLFVASDDDHDSLLSFEEILIHHDVFVGSEATDYGDHLHNIHQFQDEL
ncbi:HLH domain-containing protein [Oryctes borbonicus]|uniref:Reticulocalbin-3 n=1 Tax=Oryctes borbonicus TaxID=1629725 RepID=A0A0T6AUV3_9SCAR|nr:HLH domain-containing protein [Oryctes borbonicus]